MVQQILENKRNIGQSFDPCVGYKGQFQYSRNVDVSNLKNGITLSSLIESKQIDSVQAYCAYSYNKLIRFFSISPDFIVAYSSNSERPTTQHVIGQTTARINKAIAFQDLVFGFGTSYAVTVVPTIGGTITDITSAITWTDPDTSIVYTFTNADAVMNYSNSMLLVADGNLLRRYVPVASPGLPIGWKVIRIFEDESVIKGLTMDGNYLKIRVTDKYMQTKVHYATGTFDVEYSGLVQTIKLDNQIMESVESDMNYDYVLCRNSSDGVEYYLYRMQGVNKTLIKRTLVANGPNRTDFMYPSGENMQLKKGVLYLPMRDGIWTFRNESVSNGLSSGNVSAPSLSWYRPMDRQPKQCIIFGKYLYITYQVGLIPNQTYVEERVEIEYRPAQYQPDGFLIGLVKDGGIMSLDKENIQMNLGYLLPYPVLDIHGVPTTDPGKINIYFRYDRNSLGLGGGRELIKTLDNYTIIRDRVFITSDENFRKNWNTLEYKIEIIRSVTTPGVSPIFNELNHIYDFTERTDANRDFIAYTPTP